MSSAHPLRERFQSNSPEPDFARPTTPLRINKQSPRQGLSLRQPSTTTQVQVARRSSNSFKHVRENNLVTKSPFRTLIPSPSPRRVSGEKRPRPISLHSQAENEKPLGFKRRQSKAFQGLLQKEPVTKSPFRHPSEAPSVTPPPVPPKVAPRTPSALSVPSPVRGVLSNPRKMHGPRSVGERQLQKQKTVTFDERCDVLEFDRNEGELEEVYYDEEGYGYGYSYNQEQYDQDEFMEDSLETSLQVDTSLQVNDDSLTGFVDSMLHGTISHTPPRPEDEEDVSLLPPSPSPPKMQPPTLSQMPERSLAYSPLPSMEHDSQPQITSEELPFEDSFRSNDSLDPASLSIGASEVSLSNLDSHSLLADTSFEDVLTGASFAPLAQSSPRSRSRSATPLEGSSNRSFVTRSTPPIVSSHYNSPHSGSPFQHKLFKLSSTLSLGSTTSRRASPHALITREAVQERLVRRRSEDAITATHSGSGSPAPALVEDAADNSRTTEPTSDALVPTLPAMTRTNPTYDGVMSVDPEPQDIDPPRPTLAERAHSINLSRPDSEAKRVFAGLELDFEHGFGLGEEGMSVSAGLGVGIGARAKHSSMHLGDVSALDKLMENMAHGAGVTANTSIVSEGQSYASLKIEEVMHGVKAATFSLPDVVRNADMKFDLDSSVGDGAQEKLGDGLPNGSVDDTEEVIDGVGESEVGKSAEYRGDGSDGVASACPSPPTPLAKDAIRAREELVKVKKREAHQRKEDEVDDEVNSPARLQLRSAGRPIREGSMSTNDNQRPTTAAQRRIASAYEEDLLDITTLRGGDAPLADTINRELQKRKNMKRSNYHVREHSETIYASADAGHAGPGGRGATNPNKAWRAIRRPSDMNEYSKQLRELREMQKSDKAHGKVYVRVVGLRGLDVPIPVQPTKITCTLNNGIHFVTTPEAPLGRDCGIDQEFELIEHSKLEFTLTIKIRKDPHIAAQIKANQPPPAPRPPSQPLPPPPSKGNHSSKSGGMRSFLGLGSPKKSKAAPPVRAASPAPPPPAPTFRLQENLARYLKPDGSLGRAFITFKDISQHCDTRLMETTFPLIGQKSDMGSTAKALQIGEIVLQIFRLPPLPGIPPDQLPQSLEECHRGLTHTRWHKSCYMQGTLTQIGADCTTWRRRHLRIIGCSLVAYNDVTRRAIATIDLRRATNVEDETSLVHSPASTATARSRYEDNDPYGVGGVERSFRLEFGCEQIIFYADTDQEKDDWLKILKALIGRIPPNPLWAELLFQRQEQAKSTAQAAAKPPAQGPSR